MAPVESQTAQYTASYDAVSAKVGTKATATVKFTKDGAAATPTGVKSYALKTAVDGVAVDARDRRGHLHARRRCVRHHQDRDRGRHLLG